jgi:ribosomal protein S27E
MMAAETAPDGITLSHLGASGRHVVVQCGHCPNRGLPRASDLDLPMDTPVNFVGALLKCGECGSTDVLVYPSGRDAGRGRVR